MGLALPDDVLWKLYAINPALVLSRSPPGDIRHTADAPAGDKGNQENGGGSGKAGV